MLEDFLFSLVVGLLLFMALVIMVGIVVAMILFTRLRDLQRQFEVFRASSLQRMQELEKQYRILSGSEQAKPPQASKASPSATMSPRAEAPQSMTPPASPEPISLEPAAVKPEPSSPAVTPYPEIIPPQAVASAAPATQATAFELEETPMASERLEPSQPRATAASSSARAKTDDTVEAHLGGKLFVWIGAAALALAGVFLVKYSFDNNLISPQVRVILGVILGAALLGAGEFLRLRSQSIGQAATGAGIAVFYACILAAVNLYELISPTTGFITMIVVTAMAVGLSLRHGQGVAIMGLLGGFAMPVMLGSRFETALPLLSYLFLLQAALVFLARSRGWSHVLILTALGGALWAAVMSFIVYRPADRLALQLFILMCFGLFLAGTWARIAAEMDDPSPRGQARGPRSWGLTGVLGRGAMLLLVVLVFRSSYGAIDLLMVGVLSAALLILTRVRHAFHGLFEFAGVLCTLLMSIMAVSQLDPISDMNPIWERSLWGLGGLFVLGSYGAMWGSSRKDYWAISCSVSGWLLILTGLLGYEQMRPPGVFGIDALYMWKLIAPLGALYILAAIPWWMKRSQSPQINRVLEAFALTSLGMFALWAWYAFEDHNHLLVWAGLVLLAVLASRGLRLVSTGGYALVMGWLILLVLLVVFPFNAEYGQRWVFNGLGLIYGGCALLLGFSAWRMKDESLWATGNQLRLMALLAGILGVFWLIRHGFDSTDILRPMRDLREWAVIVLAGLAIMHGLLVWDRRSANWPCIGLAVGLLVGALLACAMVLCTSLNPLWSHQPVGTWFIFNWLLMIYGLPALLLMLLHGSARHRPNLMLGGLGGIASLILIFVLVTLQVRQYFQGDYLDGPSRTMAEMYSYSVAWILLGITLLVLGVKLGSKALRYASLVVMLLAIGKVFLVDTSELKNLYRVLSLLGLGLTLMGLGYFYQRFVFTKPASKEPV